MNCHVPAIAQISRGLHCVFRPILPTTPNRVVGSTITASPSLATHTLRCRPSTRLVPAARTYQHAATSDTQSGWAGPPAIGGFRIGLRTSLIASPADAFVAVNAVRKPHTQSRVLWRRYFSESRVVGAGRAQRTGEEQAKSQTGATPASKAAQDGANNKTLMDRLPTIHRPTKYELLAAATGFWQRLRIHFKWFSIRSVRPFTMDEIGAFVSWVFLGHLLWIVIGTTTFVSLAIYAVNTVFAQETLAGWVGNYLTKSSGTKVVFESAIVPTWNSGVITFNNVFVSRRPGQQSKKERAVSKGSSTTAAAAAAEAALSDKAGDSTDKGDDGNYTQFDVTINTVNVTLSFSKWFNGKGLLRDVEINGVRGVIDRTNVKRPETYVDPRTYLHEHNPGDFEIDDFKMSDVLLTVHQPDDFRPFTVSVFNCDLPRLRKQWLFYDFMSANNMSGSIDESLFTVHPRQVHSVTGAQLTDETIGHPTEHWKKQSRLRIDGLKIDHLNRGVEGTFSWIREGNVDIVADVMIPDDGDSVWTQSWRKSTEAMSDLYGRVEKQVTNAQNEGKTLAASTILHEAFEQTPHDEDDPHNQKDDTSSPPRFVVLDVAVHLNDVRASVPLFTKDLSYVNNALVRPIVAYINSRRAFIPVSCRVVKRQAEFDGSWTVFDSGLMDDLSREVYDAFARDIEDSHARNRRMRKVGVWTIQLAAQALFLGLVGQLA